MPPSSPLRITTYERTPEQLEAQEKFHIGLRNASKARLQWYEIEAPDAESSAMIYRENVKNGRDGWDKPTTSGASPTYISITSKMGNAPIRARLFSPPSVKCAPKQGILMHIHGGGWVFGDPDNEEVELSRLAQFTGYTVASVVYRLAPKDPYPAAIEDCLEAALFFLSKPIEQQYGKLRAMGGESAGAHLSMCLLFALRKLGVDLRSQFDGIFLNYGPYDLGLTPSGMSSQSNLILSRTDLEKFIAAWTLGQSDVRIATISPLYEIDFTMLPPTLFIVGSRDRLYDDTIMAASKCHMAGNGTEVIVFPDEYHGFCHTGGPLAVPAWKAAATFIVNQRKSSSY